MFTACEPANGLDEDNNGDQTEQPGGGNTDNPDEPGGGNQGNPNAPGNPGDIPADKTRAIKFQDENAKLICILHWDENGDGEFSYEEAAAVTNLGNAFKGSRILAFSELEFFTGLTDISNYEFGDCASLVNISLPKQITYIGTDAFSGCMNLKKVNHPDLSAWCKIDFSGSNANPLHNGAKFYVNGVEQTNLTIPSDIAEIKDYAFEGCTSLKSVTIPDSITSIGGMAFYECSSLTSVTIGNSVTSIGDNAFESCSKLSSVTIPNSVTSIGEYAFFECRSLNEVYCKPTTPPTAPVNYLGKWNAFDTSSEYTKIYVSAESVERYRSSKGWSRYASNIVGYDFDNGVIDHNVDIKVTIGSVVDITGNPDYEKDYPSDSTMCIYIEANGDELESIKFFVSTKISAEVTPEEALAQPGTMDLSDQHIPNMVQYGYTLINCTGLTPGATYNVFLGFTTIYGKTQYYRSQYTPGAAK